MDSQKNLKTLLSKAKLDISWRYKRNFKTTCIPKDWNPNNCDSYNNWITYIYMELRKY